VIQGTGPAAIYVRISSDPELLRLGVQRQEKECRARAAQLGWEVAKVYEDDDRSAFKRNDKRPAYLELLADIKAGKVKRLIAWHSDRIHRQPRELEPFMDAVIAAGVEIQTVQTGILDLSTPDGRLLARMHGAIAARESEHKSERVKLKAAELIAAGAWKGGPRPFGWEPVNKRLVHKHDEIKLLRQAKDALIAGKKSLYVITKDWKADGVRSGRGATIARSTLRSMLISPRMIGEYEGGIKGDWEPVFTRDEWEKLRAILKTKRRSKHREGGVYLLTGDILKCALCGGTMYGMPTFGGSWVGGRRETGGKFVRRAIPYYSCRPSSIKHDACGKVAMRVSAVDDEVMRQVAEYLTPFVRISDTAEDEDERNRLRKDSADLWQFRASRRISDSPTFAAASAEMAKVQEDKRGIEELRGEGSLDNDGYRAAMAKLAPRLKAAIAALEAAEGQLAGLHELAALDAAQFVTRWREMDRDERRRVVLALVSEVRVKAHEGHTTKPDPNRVEVLFRPELPA
jgi:DNA invertase Pin-like site-specific DNA recombinase